MNTKEIISFNEASYFQLMEMYRILPEIQNRSVDELFHWVDGTKTLKWFNHPDGGAPTGWRFRRNDGGWAGQ